MPRIVDHEQRRREIAAAVWRVLEREGLRGTSVRAVVRESGLSSGAIRHYFASQDELLRFASQIVRERVPDRLDVVLRNRRLSPRRRAVLLLEELVPLDRQRRTELQVHAALAELERTSPMNPEFLVSTYRGVQTLTRAVVLLLAGCPVETEPRDPLTPDLERLAERLHLAVDGVCGQYLFYPGLLSAAALRRTLHRAVDGIESELQSGR